MQYLASGPALRAPILLPLRPVLPAVLRTAVAAVVNSNLGAPGQLARVLPRNGPRRICFGPVRAHSPRIKPSCAAPHTHKGKCADLHILAAAPLFLLNPLSSGFMKDSCPISSFVLLERRTRASEATG